MNVGSTVFHLSLVFLVSCGAFEIAAAGAQPEEQSDAPPPLPRFRLADLEPGDDGAPAQGEDVIREVDRLVELAGKAGDTETRVRLKLAAANVCLARGVEPACTQWMLVGREDGDGLEAPLERAFALLEDVRTMIDGVADAAEAPAWTADLERKRDTLRAFAVALVRLVGGARIAAAREPDLESGTGLAAWMEDSDKGVASAATLYRAGIRLKRDRPERAAAILDLAVAAPSHEALAYGFFSRLLRCRAIARQGGYATALALLYQVEERCVEWFVTDREREDAVRAVTLVELVILREWYAALDSESGKAERAWCSSTMDRLIDERFADEPATVFRLGEAIPTVAPAPEAVVDTPQ